MSEPAWWGREAGRRASGRTVTGPGPSGVQPELVDGTREQAREALRARLAGYTPDWTNPDPLDAGVALVRLFGSQLEPVLQRVNRLPEKILVEELRLAGVSVLPATPATAVLQFTVRPPDQRSVLVPAGFQVGAAPAGGGEQVVFETEHDLWATAAELRSIVAEAEGLRLPVAAGSAGVSAAFAPLGDRPRPGNTCWIGLGGAAEPYPNLSIGVVVRTAPVPPPASAGDPVGQGPGTPPLLRWDVLDGNTFRPVEVIRDGTDALRTTGVVELRLPAGWEPAQPGRAPAGGLRWLRLTLAHGEFAEPPVLTDLRLNEVVARATRTIRDEALEPVQQGTPDGRTRLRVSRVPVVRRSLHLEVDDDTGSGLFGTGPTTASRWDEVPSLAGRSAEDPVFTLDPETGVVTFGDGVQGRKVPPGFRNVRAVSYRVGGGRAGQVPAGSVTALVTSLPNVTGVTNRLPASGGTDAEDRAAALRRGAAQLRSRGRAVAPSDYGLQALAASGALIARAHAVAGVDPAHPGVPTPGVVGVYVVPPVTEGGDPPVPTAATLQAVADHLSRGVAPIGVRVVAAAPRYQRLRLEVWLVLDPDHDRSEVLLAATDDLRTYLDPLAGGEDGAGWPFGGPLRIVALTRRLLAVPGVLAVPRLSTVLDGLRSPHCVDQALQATALPWLDQLLLIPVPAGTALSGGSS